MRVTLFIPAAGPWHRTVRVGGTAARPLRRSPRSDNHPLRPRPIDPASPNAAFTLVELLATIAIIALLILILLPSLAGARRQARSIACRSNLSQLGKAVYIYANRFNDFVPQAYGGPVAWGRKRGALYRLMVSSGITRPSASFPKVLICPEADPRDAISFALNAVFFGYRDPIDPNDDGDGPEGPTLVDISPMELSLVKKPAKLVAIYDVSPYELARVWNVQVNDDEADISDQFTGNATNDWAGLVKPNPAGFMWHESEVNPGVIARPPHDKSHNILFVDSHVAPTNRWKPEEMTRLAGWEPNDGFLY